MCTTDLLFSCCSHCLRSPRRAAAAQAGRAQQRRMGYEYYTYNYVHKYNDRLHINVRIKTSIILTNTPGAQKTPRTLTREHHHHIIFSDMTYENIPAVLWMRRRRRVRNHDATVSAAGVIRIDSSSSGRYDRQTDRQRSMYNHSSSQQQAAAASSSGSSSSSFDSERYLCDD